MGSRKREQVKRHRSVNNVIFSGNYTTSGCLKVASFQYRGKASSSTQLTDPSLNTCCVPGSVGDALYALSHWILEAFSFSLHRWENWDLGRWRVQPWNIFKSSVLSTSCRLPQRPTTAALSLPMSYFSGKMSSQQTSRPTANSYPLDQETVPISLPLFLLGKLERQMHIESWSFRSLSRHQLLSYSSFMHLTNSGRLWRYCGFSSRQMQYSQYSKASHTNDLVSQCI